MLPKRKIKFKDGTTGSYTPQPKPQTTMFTCDRGNDCVNGSEFAGSVSPAYLTDTEFSHGSTCAACLLADKMKINAKEEQERKLRQKKDARLAMLKMEQSIKFMPDFLPLETKVIDYIGVSYKLELYNEKGVRYPCVKITNTETGITVYHSGKIEEKEGREVHYYSTRTMNVKGVFFLPPDTI
jgi:hypothetical protein